MIAFLVLGGIGIVLLIVALVIGDHFDGVFDNWGGDWLSGAAIAGFLGALGFAGAIAYGASDNLTIAIIVGIVVGIAMGVAVGVITARLRSEDDGTTVRSSELVGTRGTVVSDIPAAEGYGVISVRASGHLTRLNARSAAALPAGTPVVVAQVLSPTSVSVERME